MADLFARSALATMPIARLEDRALISISGPDAEPLLQNIITTDLDGLAPGEARAGALLNPQGKILFDFLVSRAAGNGFILECRADIAGDFMRRLLLYKLRAKVEISKQEQSVVAVSWPNESAPSGIDSTSSRSDSGTSQIESGWIRDARFPNSAVFRSYAPAPAGDPTSDAWHAFRIGHGVAESGADYALGDAFPHDVLLDELGGIGFRKGCYVGQEVVSRMQHRGTARRRVLIVTASGMLPEPGASVTAGGRSLGLLGSVAGKTGLAILRIDRVKEALDAGAPIAAGAVPVQLAIPAFAKFTFPNEAAAIEEA
jgi:folate-binding protein YgfZ